MFSRILGAAGLIGVLMAAAPAGASSAPVGHVSFIQVMANGVVLFNHNGNRTALPGCATNLGRWSFDGATPAGQAKLAVLMSIYMSGKQIVINGTGTCPDIAGIESVSDFYVSD